MNRDRLHDIATVALVACALVTTVTVMASRFAGTKTRVTRGPALRVEKEWKSYLAGGHDIGPESARVTMVAFSDFQCPFCRRLAQFHDSLVLLGMPVTLKYRHFPIASHRYSTGAAIASECAADQGRFPEMLRILFKNADSLGIASWCHLARAAGVADSGVFANCLTSTRPLSMLAADTVAGVRLGVNGTPTLLIGSLRIDGLPAFDSLFVYVQRAIASSDAGQKR